MVFLFIILSLSFPLSLSPLSRSLNTHSLTHYEMLWWFDWKWEDVLWFKAQYRTFPFPILQKTWPLCSFLIFAHRCTQIVNFDGRLAKHLTCNRVKGKSVVVVVVVEDYWPVGFNPPLEVVHPFQHTWHHSRQGYSIEKLPLMSQILDIKIVYFENSFAVC